MQELIIITPVAEPHRLAALYKSMEHDYPIIIHWFVIFDLSLTKYFHTWKSVFDFAQVREVNVHCLLSDRVRPVSESHYNRNLVFEMLENHVVKMQPLKNECWVYQLEDTNELHPAFTAFIHDRQNELRYYDMIVFNDVVPTEKQLSVEGFGTYAFRLRVSKGMRHSRMRCDFLTRLINRTNGRIFFSEQKLYSQNSES
jgi:hypothetical protein